MYVSAHQVLIYIMAAFAVLGAVDRICGNDGAAEGLYHQKGLSGQALRLPGGPYRAGDCSDLHCSKISFASGVKTAPGPGTTPVSRICRASSAVITRR